MALNILNQEGMSSKINSYMTSLLSTNSNKNTSGAFYAKKGEPMYQESMDSDKDGIVTFEDFKTYCKNNNVSSKDVTDMLELRLAYRMSQNSSEQTDKTSNEELSVGSLDLIYAKDGDGNYNAEQDLNKDSRVSYNEYLRYCEQNARMEARNSDTKVVEDNKTKFMTVSFGHASNAYNRVEAEAPEGKVEGRA